MCLASPASCTRFDHCQEVSCLPCNRCRRFLSVSVLFPLSFHIFTHCYKPFVYIYSFERNIGVCLAKTLQLSLSISFHFSKKKIHTFLHILYHINIFYYYSNKKTYYKTKLFHFSIKHSQILYHINHFLLNNTNIPQHNYLPNMPYKPS